MTTLFDHKDYVPPQKKNISEPQAAYALREGWKKVYGKYPSDKSWAIIWAKTCLETGHFKVGFWNFNFGNIKKKFEATNNDKFTMYRCSEILKKKEIFFDPPHIQTAFRAYESLEDGAESYIRFVSGKERYKKAWQKLLEGDAAAYITELKTAGYFTGSLETYRNTVVSLVNSFIKRKDDFINWKPTDKITFKEIGITEQELIYYQQIKTLDLYAEEQDTDIEFIEDDINLTVDKNWLLTILEFLASIFVRK
jgi:hypothetical protein